MTSTEAQHQQPCPSSNRNYAVDAIDAHTQARDLVEDFAAIFEVLTHLDDENLCNKRIARLLYRAGSSHATEQLSVLEEQISEAYQALEKRKASRTSDFPS